MNCEYMLPRTTSRHLYEEVIPQSDGTRSDFYISGFFYQWALHSDTLSIPISMLALLFIYVVCWTEKQKLSIKGFPIYTRAYRKGQLFHCGVYLWVEMGIRWFVIEYLVLARMLCSMYVKENLHECFMMLCSALWITFEIHKKRSLGFLAFTQYSPQSAFLYYNMTT